MGQTNSVLSAEQAAALAEEQGNPILFSLGFNELTSLKQIFWFISFLHSTELKKKKRAEVIAEIIKTEETYVGCLNTVIFVFLRPLQFNPDTMDGKAATPRRGSQLRRPHVSDEEVKTIFSIIEELHRIHADFLTELVHETQPETGKDCVGHVFLNNVSPPILIGVVLT